MQRFMLAPDHEMAASAEALVGRRHELELLERTLEEVDAGSVRVLALSGEAGIGKTRLLDELVRRADSRGWLVFHGQGSQFESELAFGILLDACDDYLASLDARSLDRVAGDGVAELATIFPSLRDSVAQPLDLPADERNIAYRRMRELLDGFAARQPVLLALDDVHWADDSSVELLSYLLLRQPPRRVALALAYRRAHAAPRLAAAIERLARESKVDRLELEVLTPDEADGLLAGLPGEQRDLVYRQAGGNPFYIEQLARHATGHQAATASTGHAVAIAGVPPAVAASLAEELDALSTGATRMLDAAAVAGDPFESELAGAVAELPEAEALEALDELLAHDFVRPGELPRRFGFRHPLLRQAVYEGISAGWRIGAHARAAATLSEWGQPPERRAHHLEQSATVGDLEAIELLGQAGRATAASAPASAARWFEAALRLLPGSDRMNPTRLELLVAHAGALAAVGRLEPCRTALVETLALLPPDASDMHVRLTGACAGVEHLLGRHDAARARVDAALEQLGDPRSEPGVALTMEQAVGAFYAMDFDAMRERAREALAAARELDHPVLLATAAALVCYAGAATADIDEARAHHAEAATRIASLTDQELAAWPNALSHLGWAEFFLELYDDAIADLQRGIRVARMGGQGQLARQMEQGLGVSLLMHGRLPEARALFENLVDASRLADNRQAVLWSLTNVCWAASWQGEPEAAIRAGEEAVELAGDLGQAYLAATAHCSLATAYLDAGEPERCVDMLVGATGGPDLPLTVASIRCIFYDALTRAELERGRAAEAEAWAERSAEHAARLGLPLARAEADRARARVMTQAGDTPAAAELALASADAAEWVGAAIESARSRLVAGQALAAGGNRSGALATLRRAADELEARRALRFHAEARRELRRLGERPSAPTAPGKADAGGLGSLTAREREVAELVTDRRTNQEIANELFLTVKTIETHMRNIFRKLGVSSRVEVARLLERERRQESH
jgi:DNA-binding NarL/FixJ family response regulator/tetratricopeptide (TPR) repeat protein